MGSAARKGGLVNFSDQLGDRQYISQFGTDPVGIVVHKGGILADADANAVQVKMTTIDGLTTIFNRSAAHTETGVYETIPLSSETARPGLYLMRWDYSIDGVPQFFQGVLEVGESSPAYDALDIGMRGIVESSWLRFADLFDSPEGGPHLQVYFQARFTRGRMAQLLQVALNKLNTMAQPHMTYSLEQQNQFPFAQWGGLLDMALYIEAIKHLVRSYTEQPAVEGVTTARLDRRDYMERWMRVLEIEQRDFESMSETFKIAHMGLGRPRVLVSGGVYGNFGPTRLPGNAVARPRYWASFYALLLIVGMAVASLGCGLGSRISPTTSGRGLTSLVVQTPAGLGHSRSFPQRGTASASCSKCGTPSTSSPIRIV